MGPPHSPQLHRKAERFNRTVLDFILPTLLHSKLPTHFWEESARNNLTALNASPSRTNPGSATPFSLFEDKATSYQRMKTFGCKCWRMVTGPTRGGKLSPKGSACLYLCTLPDGDGWMVWDTTLAKQVKSHDVMFFEDQLPGLGLIGEKMRQEWVDWETCTSKDGPLMHSGASILTDHSADQLTMLERRLSDSQHNPARHSTSTPGTLVSTPLTIYISSSTTHSFTYSI